MTGLTNGLRAFVNLIEVVADNKFMMGERLVEIGIGAPDIEASTAAIAMAQGELGHARILYNWTHDLAQKQGAKPDVKEQTGKAFQGVMDANSWIELIAALYTVDVAQDIVLLSILDARREDVITRIHKLFKEQKEHILYSRGWATRLLNDEGAIPRKFNEALDAITPEVGNWLKELEQNQDLAAEGFILEESRLTEKFKNTLGGLRLAGDVVHAN